MDSGLPLKSMHIGLRAVGFNLRSPEKRWHLQVARRHEQRLEPDLAGGGFRCLGIGNIKVWCPSHFQLMMSRSGNLATVDHPETDCHHTCGVGDLA